MNKRAARILILFLVFAASVGVFTHLMDKKRGECDVKKKSTKKNCCG